MFLYVDISECICLVWYMIFRVWFYNGFWNMLVVYFFDVVWEWMVRWIVEMFCIDDGSDVLFFVISVIVILLDFVWDSVS